MEQQWLVFTKTFLPLLISSVIINAGASLATTWVRARENDVIMGSPKPTRMESFNLSLVSCVRTCIQFDWCSKFVVNEEEGSCELFQSQEASFNNGSSLFKSGLYREQQSYEDNPDWCPVDVDESLVFSPAAQFCFRIPDNTSATWEGSKAACMKQGLTLAVPDTPVKMRVLLNIILTIPGDSHKEFFIGASRPTSNLSANWDEKPETFDWITGTRIPEGFLKLFWAKDRPNNQDGVQSCLTIAKDLGPLLNDLECDERQHFICEKTRD